MLLVIVTNGGGDVGGDGGRVVVKWHGVRLVYDWFWWF